MAGFSLAAAGMPTIGVLGGLGEDAGRLANETPTFVLAVVCIAFAITIVALFKQLVKTGDRHHVEWASREKALAEERERRHNEMAELIRRNTEALSGVKTAVANYQNARGNNQ